MSNPVVSVVIPTFNRKHTLNRALDSVVAQTYTDWEIILVDDGSTDGTESLASEYTIRLGEKFDYIQQEEHAGCCAARNRGIEESRGKYIAFLDSDDEFIPNKLERQLELFEADPDLGFVYSDFSYVDLDGNFHPSVFDTQCPKAREVEYTSVGENLCVCCDKLFDTLLKSYFISTIVGMVKRDVLGNTIRFTKDPAYSEEWLFYLHVVRRCKSGFVDEPLCIHHHIKGSEARTSSHRNTYRLYQLYHEMLRVLQPLSFSQRRPIHQHIATITEQLGITAYRNRKYLLAYRYFIECLKKRPRFRLMGYLFQSIIGLIFSPENPNNKPPDITQGTTHPVR